MRTPVFKASPLSLLWPPPFGRTQNNNQNMMVSVPGIVGRDKFIAKRDGSTLPIVKLTLVKMADAQDSWAL